MEDPTAFFKFSSLSTEHIFFSMNTCWKNNLATAPRQIIILKCVKSYEGAEQN